MDSGDVEGPAANEGRPGTPLYDPAAGTGAFLEKALEHLVLGQGLDGARRFGALLRSIRKSQGRSGNEVAAAAKISASYLRALERGTRAPSPKVAQQILHALGVEVQSPAEDLPEQVDVSFTYDGQMWELDFKRWTGRSPRGRQSMFDVVTVDALRNELLTIQAKHSEAEEGPSRLIQGKTDALVGKIVRRLPQLDPLAINALSDFTDALVAADEQARGPLIEDLMKITPASAASPARRQAEHYMESIRGDKLDLRKWLIEVKPDEIGKPEQI